MTFGALVVHYGGWTWPPAIAGAKATAAKCTLLGGKWLSPNLSLSRHAWICDVPP